LKQLVLAARLACALTTAAGGAAHADSIPLKVQGGTLVLPVIINDRIRLDFVLDSGASDVSIPLDVFSTLRRTGTISDGDLLPPATYRLADGTTQQQYRFRIRSLRTGDFELLGVVGSVSPPQGELLLGQSFLRRLRNWSIDNERRVLVINGTIGEVDRPKVSAMISPSDDSRPSADRTSECTPAQIRDGECDDRLSARTVKPPPYGDNAHSSPQTPEPRWARCTPAQIRVGECN